MSAPFIGEIRLVAFSVLPKGWAYCNGALMAIAQNQALFSLLGTNFGGDGRTTFGLPDFRGRIAVGAGQGNGKSNYTLGEQGGVEAYSLQLLEMGPHSHTMVCDSAAATTTAPVNNFAVPTSKEINMYGTSTDSFANPAMVQPAGSGQGHENRQPFLTVAYLIATQGIFPSRP